MRKLALVLVGVVLGALTWQVGFAAPALDSLVVCERAGADLRSPAANGTCPSGFTKKEISETAAADTTTYAASGGTQAYEGAEPHELLGFDLPAGSYLVNASGTLTMDAGVGAMQCSATHPDGGSSGARLVDDDADPELGTGSLAVTATLDEPGRLSLLCDLDNSTNQVDVNIFWQITVTRVSGIVD